MKNTITKVVIPAAGFGTRFLPQTKAMPKEMLPIVDKPVIQYVVEEAVNSGVKDIVIVTGSSKRAIEDHFDTPSEDLLNNLKQGHKEKYIEEITKIAEMANFIYIRQKGPYGNGTPVLTAEPIIGNESFAVMWGDEFIYAEPPRLKQMIEAWQKFGGVMISGVRIEDKSYLSRYGIAEYEPVEDNVYKINRIVEKPTPEEAPSNLATHGAYILPPEIFKALKNLAPGKGGEIWLPDAINVLREQGIPIYACEIKNGKYYDTGNKLEYMKTVIDLALKHPDINGPFREYLKTLDL
ncbi:UTP--glucose-1-phosphate uridylyltransferase [Candidatus Roizmanbacteria bacterium RIFCSPHIGHO2_12_FULL_44_10]|uniref:UTP--glucose-1-phosphate uridylyltransferase n=1 Tax=Candidatus Roizmanbacteria bacterium RIFCSPHIGHO2_12_FULL_44_10 TaxID=1802054 RepID=A0A1F7I7T5_9BACT|nr:MAG: UTP--glucose-1-phosphate uridylyltransferase [Candidatus Roizmanbacteria bacterium RIFCSPHIGHO2_12_FULL_44_10]